MDRSTNSEGISGRSAPQRTCVGCGEVNVPSALLRLVSVAELGGESEHRTTSSGIESASGGDAGSPVGGASDTASDSLPVVVDLRQRFPGRGAWVAPRRACVSRAVRKGRLTRALKLRQAVSEPQLLAHLVSQLERRAQGLLLAAHRRRSVAIGMDAVQAGSAAGAPLVMVVAKDASERTVRKARGILRSGQRCCRFGTRDSLGKLMGRGEVAVFALLELGIAQEFATAADRMIALSEDR